MNSKSTLTILAFLSASTFACKTGSGGSEVRVKLVGNAKVCSTDVEGYAPSIVMSYDGSSILSLTAKGKTCKLARDPSYPNARVPKSYQNYYRFLAGTKEREKSCAEMFGYSETPISQVRLDRKTLEASGTGRLIAGFETSHGDSNIHYSCGANKAADAGIGNASNGTDNEAIKKAVAAVLDRNLTELGKSLKPSSLTGDALTYYKQMNAKFGANYTVDVIALTVNSVQIIAVETDTDGESYLGIFHSDGKGIAKGASTESGVFTWN